MRVIASRPNVVNILSIHIVEGARVQVEGDSVDRLPCSLTRVVVGLVAIGFFTVLEGVRVSLVSHFTPIHHLLGLANHRQLACHVG